jgi:phage tail sheath protein FI
MAFFHGITVTEVSNGGVTVQVVNSAVIGLIGSAPQWSVPSGTGPGVNAPTLVTSQNQASKFGKVIAGYTIPGALVDIQEQGAGAVIVIDVFNPLVHQSSFSINPITGPVSNAVPISLGHMGLIGPGLPNTPLSTLSMDSVFYPGGAAGASYATGDTITVGGGTFSVAAVLTVATTQLVSLALNAAGGSASHSYAPGDGITLTGGTSSVAPVLAVTSTKVVSATVAAGGSGGTNGTQTVTGTTGTGTRFQASVTVSGGAITAVLSISLAGSYTTNPTALATEPVTGAGLVGAELNVIMGVNTFNIVNPGSFTVNSATFTQASSTGNGLGATFNTGIFGVLTATVSTPGTYSAIPANPVSQSATSGSGTGALFNLTFAGPPTTVVVKNAAGSTTYVENTDYTIDYVNGLLYTKAGGAITSAQSLQVAGSYCDPSKVASSDIIGSVTAGVYTGIQALQTTFQTMGIFAKLLITPTFTDTATSAALLSMANKIRAIAFTDAPQQTSVATAVANRGVQGNAFNQASDRLVLCFPYQLKTAIALLPTGVTISPQGVIGYTYATGTVESPYSQWVAGATSAKDLASGFWFSPSNTAIVGTLGPDVSLYMSAYDPGSDTNTLNAAGILTEFNGFGTGYRVWGNRASSFPSSTAVTTFIPVRRTLDVIEQSIQVASLPFVDQPITNGLINSILTAVNGFLRKLIQQGALLPGSAIIYNPADNPVPSLQAGQLTFEVNVMPPPPAEQIVYQFFVDTALLSNLGPTVTSNNNAQQVLPTA